MKFIFDFDDVLSHTTRHRKEHMFVLLEKAGISQAQIDAYYKEARLSGFSLKIMLEHFSLDLKIDKDKLYEEIMSEYRNYRNKELFEIIEKLGKENSFLITHGGTEFQNDKIERADVAQLFGEIFILIGSKKKVVENICEEYKNETVIFVDDKSQYFEDLDFVKYPNLKTILYDEEGLKKIKEVIKE